MRESVTTSLGTRPIFAVVLLETQLSIAFSGLGFPSICHARLAPWAAFYRRLAARVVIHYRRLNYVFPDAFSNVDATLETSIAT